MTVLRTLRKEISQHISRGNQKLGRDTIIWNMGPAMFCPSRELGMCQLAWRLPPYKRRKDGIICSAVNKCYALSCELRWPKVLDYRCRQKILWLNNDADAWAEALQSHITDHSHRLPIKYARFNEAGDFWTQECVNKLKCIIELHLRLVGQDRDLAIITQVELRHSLHFMDQLSRSKVGEYLRILAGVIALGQREGAFRPDSDPVLVSKAIFGVLDEMATDWVLSRRNKRLDTLAADVSDLLLRGLV